jgi:hypothetical protein
MTPNTAQPIPDTEGEWRVDPESIHGWRVIDGATERRIVGEVYFEEDARQIAADHKAAKSQVLLVEALREIIERAQFALTTPGFIRGRDELQKAVDAALKAAGVEK